MPQKGYRMKIRAEIRSFTLSPSGADPIGMGIHHSSNPHYWMERAFNAATPSIVKCDSTEELAEHLIHECLAGHYEGDLENTHEPSVWMLTMCGPCGDEWCGRELHTRVHLLPQGVDSPVLSRDNAANPDALDAQYAVLTAILAENRYTARTAERDWEDERETRRQYLYDM